MSLQVSNQSSTGGRRTPLVYQSFGGANVPAGAASAGGAAGPAANGAGGNAAGGGGGRSAKGGGGGGGAAGKQSQIPVAVGTVGAEAGSPAASVAAAAAPPPVVVHLVSGAGNSTLPVGAFADVPSLAFAAQKQQLLQQQQQQLDQIHFGGALKQQQTTLGDAANKEQTSATRKATNGSSNNGAGGGVQPTVGGGSPVAKKADLAGSASNNGSSAAADGGKLRDGSRSSGRTQQKAAAAEEAQKTPEKPKEKQQTGGNKTPQKTPTGESSLLADKTLVPFDDEAEEMESLLMEPWEYEDSPVPAQPASAAKSKLPKPAPTAHARVAPYKSTGKQGDDAAAGDNSTPKATEAPGGTPSGSASAIGRPLRSISGRRTTRPINEIRYTHQRRSAELNDSISSLNVTVGSDVCMDSLHTPGSATRKRKDMTPESTSDPVESPKRARLDFSGFLGIVASPVTMLKNRLSRVKLQPSTPRSLAVDEEDASKVVTAEATTTTAAGPAADDDAAKEPAGPPAKMELDEKQDDGAPAAAAKKEGDDDDTNPPQQSTSSAAAVVDESEDEVEVKIVTDKPKQWCSVM